MAMCEWVKNGVVLLFFARSGIFMLFSLFYFLVWIECGKIDDWYIKQKIHSWCTLLHFDYCRNVRRLAGRIRTQKHNRINPEILVVKSLSVNNICRFWNRFSRRTIGNDDQFNYFGWKWRRASRPTGLRIEKLRSYPINIGLTTSSFWCRWWQAKTWIYIYIYII